MPGKIKQSSVRLQDCQSSQQKHVWNKSTEYLLQYMKSFEEKITLITKS